MKIKLKLGQIVMIQWEDATTPMITWQDKTIPVPPLRCVSVGKLIHIASKNEPFYTLAADWTTDPTNNNVGRIITIPQAQCLTIRNNISLKVRKHNARSSFIC
jgi:hypothetical protein